MCSLVRLWFDQNSVNRGVVLIFRRKVEQPRIRFYCQKKNEVVEKLCKLENKIDKITEDKVAACLEAKCKQKDTSVPDCKVGTSTAPRGRSEPVKPIPTVCPNPKEDTCIRPFYDPCPQYPIKPCMPHYRPVDPCREPCKRPHVEKYQRKEMSNRTRMILLGLSAVLAMVIIYRLWYTGKEDEPQGNKVKKRRMKVIKVPERYPYVSAEIPENVPFVIVGGGPAAHSAMKNLLNFDKEAKILIINKEPYIPYNRTPLNTEFLTGERKHSKALMYIPYNADKKKSIFYENESFYKPPLDLFDTEGKPGPIVCVARGWAVKQVNCDRKYVILEDGKKIYYDKCILATGSSPKNLSIFTDNSEAVKKKVSTFSTLYDYLYLEEVIDSHGEGLTIAIVGGGWNGSELACSLRRRGINVVQVYKEKGNMRKILPGYLSDWLTKTLMNLGVQIYTDTELVDALLWEGGENDKRIGLIVDVGRTGKTSTIFADHVIVSVGNKPNTQFADVSGIEVDEERGGFVVNRELEVRKDIYAIGDCISYYDRRYGRRHTEHYEHAMETGRVAAGNLFGKARALEVQTRVWSDVMPALGYEAYGLIDSNLATVGVYVKGGKDELKKVETEAENKPSKNQTMCDLEDLYKGAVFYLKNEVVVGVLTWNIFNRGFRARSILQSMKKYDDIDEIAKLLSLHTT